MNLYELEVNDLCRVKALPEDVGLLKALGLRNDLLLRVTNKQPMGGPIILMNETRNIAIGKIVAQKIKVERCGREDG